jgi:hypothetical protein
MLVPLMQQFSCHALFMKGRQNDKDSMAGAMVRQTVSVVELS